MVSSPGFRSVPATRGTVSRVDRAVNAVVTVLLSTTTLASSLGVSREHTFTAMVFTSYLCSNSDDVAHIGHK